jgi:microcystin-dependent protein
MSEVKIISWNFAPQGWAFCNGQFLPINQNQALFSLLGTTYGGNGQTTFALPDLRGRASIHVGAGFIQGQAGGEEFHTVSMSQMPAHNHMINASSTAGNTNDPSAHLLAANASPIYKQPSSLVAMTPENITNTGGSQPHENRQPFLVLNFIIALQGVFPSRN